MGKNLAGLFIALSLLVPAPPLTAQDDAGDEPYSSDELDNLLAPIALYPDPLLAQVLVAATFPDEVDLAARFRRDDANADDVDDQPWDVSVKAVAHYPEVLEMMADKLDWTTALGQAYVNQSTDVMLSVQRLRAQARATGSLTDSSEMQVVDSGGEIELWPAQPEVLFVPSYDPAVVFFVRGPLFFHARYPIGAWLNYDCDWRGHRVFYHGWAQGRGWVERSRPYIRASSVYVDNRYRNVAVNRDVVQRRVDHGALVRYDDVHRAAGVSGFHPAARGAGGPPGVSAVQNKILARNINTSDPRLDEYRGHVSRAPARATETPAFSPAHGGFDPRAASRRGQTSRTLAQPPRPQMPAQPAGGKRR
jgi:hypothetical protein